MISVTLGERSYDILIEPGVIARAGSEIKQRLNPGKIMIVADEAAAEHYLFTLIRSLADAGLDVIDPLLLPPGEASKSFAGFERVCEHVLAARPDRQSLLVALGGGVTGDLTGFAAATVLRGLDFVQVPTTLLAQVDSGVGGKTAINARAGKNLVGAFHQPRLVLSDVATLDTLPHRQLLSGYVELVKHALIRDRAFFDHLETHVGAFLAGDASARGAAIERSCAIKAAIVMRDEHEHGDRALLNLGHTFGHALEAMTGFGRILTHGECVAIGCVLAFALSVELGLCPAQDAARVTAHLAGIGLPTALDPAWGIETDAFIAAMRGDKKNSGGKLRFILARGIGDVFHSNGVEETRLKDFLRPFTG